MKPLAQRDKLLDFFDTHFEPPRSAGPSGRTVLLHRAIGQVHSPAQRMTLGAAIAVLFTALLLLMHADIATAWGNVLSATLRALDLAGLTIWPAQRADGWFSLAVPLVELPAQPQSPGLLMVHACVVALLWWVAGLLPDAGKPGAYLLRFAMLIHGMSVLYFWFWPGSFLHSVPEHTANGLRQTWSLLLLTPWLHLGTYYLFPFPLRQGVALTAITLVYLIVLAPLQYALHAALLHHLGLVVMPLLYLLFGAMLDILGFVALYGWAMSWKGHELEAGRP